MFFHPGSDFDLFDPQIEMVVIQTASGRFGDSADKIGVRGEAQVVEGVFGVLFMVLRIQSASEKERDEQDCYQ